MLFFFTVQKRVLNRSDSALVGWWGVGMGAGGSVSSQLFFSLLTEKKKNKAYARVCTCF